METCIVCRVLVGEVCVHTYVHMYVYPVQCQCSHVSQLRCVSLSHIVYDVGGSHVVCLCVCPCMCAFVPHSSSLHMWVEGEGVSVHCDWFVCLK